MESDYAQHLEFLEQRKDALCQRLAGFAREKRLTLEIGSGHGHWLTAYAQAHPHETCLGIDILTRRVYLCERKRDRIGIPNLHFLKAEATECLECLPAQTRVAKCFLLFPDPWPKQRHHKNRIIQRAFLNALHRKASRDAVLHFRTDHAGSFKWGVDRLSENPHWEIDSAGAWPFEEESYFQRVTGGNFQSVIARHRAPDESLNNEVDQQT